MARLSRADLEAVLAFFVEVGTVTPPLDRAEAWVLERLARLIAFEEAVYVPVDDDSAGSVNRCGTRTPHVLQANIAAQGGAQRALELVRCGTEYTEHERQLLDAVRPALIAYEAHRVLARGASELQSGPRHAARDDRLSPREEEVLDLVATGATNAEIAERLSIAAATVRKHLEHIYLKLAVSTRTAALARTGRSSGAASVQAEVPPVASLARRG
jgi:DNA-binding CsgD family transcriptional regulator